jgi:hypothetical protein
MKKIFILSLILFLTNKCLSQNLEKIKQSEVLFILHNGTNGNYQSKRISQKFKDKRASITYNFFFKEENYYSLQSEVMRFIYWHYSDFDEQYKDNPVPYFRLNKSFFKKNKDIIVTGEFMQKIGYIESIKLINNAKTIFLIDKSEIQKKEIILKEVRYSYVAEE